MGEEGEGVSHGRRQRDGGRREEVEERLDALYVCTVYQFMRGRIFQQANVELFNCNRAWDCRMRMIARVLTEMGGQPGQ